MGQREDVKTILKEHKREFVRNYKVREIGVFGSYARNEQKKASDVDILVEFEEVPDLFKFLELERTLEKLLGKRVDLVRKQALRPELKDRILSTVFYL